MEMAGERPNEGCGSKYTVFGHDEFSAEEQAAIQRTLQQRLGPQFIRSVSGRE